MRALALNHNTQTHKHTNTVTEIPAFYRFPQSVDLDRFKGILGKGSDNILGKTYTHKTCGSPRVG